MECGETIGSNGKTFDPCGMGLIVAQDIYLTSSFSLRHNPLADTPEDILKL
jgi:hypothetical protein